MLEVIDNDFKEVVDKIKDEIRTTNIKTMQQVNCNLIMMYFRIGKILEENSKYGNSNTSECISFNKTCLSEYKWF